MYDYGTKIVLREEKSLENDGDHQPFPIAL